MPRVDFEDDSEEEWKAVCNLRFSLRASEGSDTEADQQIDHVRRFVARTRYRDDLKPGMRIKMLDRLLNISGLPIDVDQRRRWLDFNCEELA